VTLLDQVLDAHGGAARWHRARTVHARARSGGLLLRSRVPGNRFADYRLTVEIAEPRTVLDPFPADGLRAVFDRGAVRIEAADGGRVVAERADPRPAFFGRSGWRRNLRWDALDAAYFAGYAMWNYLTMPVLLTRDGVTLAEGEPWTEGNEEWRRLEVDFPDGLDTHSPQQTFYFDGAGLLRRHDYTAAVVGRWAKAGHYCSDHAQAGGLVFPTRRRVHPIRPGNRPLPFPTMVWIELSEIHVDNG
jgi:hypothetical protein